MRRLRRVADGPSETPALPPAIIASSFDDELWWIATAQGRNSITWSIELADGSQLTAGRHRDWLRTCKNVLIAACLYGETRGRGRKGGKSLLSFYYGLKGLVVWMSRRQLLSFAALTPAHVVGYRNFINNLEVSNRGKQHKLAIQTRAHRFAPLRVLVYHAERFGSHGAMALNENETLDLLRVRMIASGRTKRIPDELFERLLNAALVVLKRAKHTPPKSMEDLLSTRVAGFIVIAGFVGMRISEILSIKRRDSLAVMVLADGRKLLKLAATLYKTSRELRGEPAEWVAGWDDGNNAVRLAVEVLQELPDPAGYGRLFGPLVDWQPRYDDPILAQPTLNRTIHTFATAIACIPRSEWLFAAHQFRKTFARFVALSSPRATFALMRHFKHVSIQMTERYFPNDPELINEIYEAHEELVAERLDVIFGASRLGGIKGEQIVARNGRFRGSAGAEARRELIQMTLRDPRAAFRLLPYGACIYEVERAKCEGMVENVGLDTCMVCPNNAIDESHADFWIEQLRCVDAAITTHEALGIMNLVLHRQRAQALEVLMSLGLDRYGRPA